MNVSTLVHRLRRASSPLTTVGLIMLAALGLSIVGLIVDPRLIGGVPAWLKPAKFAISTAIYALTFAWIFTYLGAWPRLTRIVGGGTAAILVLEVALIDLQAARGTTSHFNAGTTLDMTIFAVMGMSIAIAWVLSVALTVALFRQRFDDAALGWALRLGLLITVLGSATGGLMTRPTAAQLERARSEHVMPIAGAHTVGAPDGGSGIPGTGWSLDHGDLRVPHFIGLHAVQVLPVMAWLFGRVRSSVRVRGVLLAAASYASLFAILLWQALSGQSVVAPSGAILAALIVWLIGTVGGAVAVRRASGNGFSTSSGVMVRS